MFRLASKLLILLAVVLMPLGMGPAPAAAKHDGDSAMMMVMPTEHCPDPLQDDRKASLGDCTMACAAALPAFGRTTAEPLMVVCAPAQPATAHLLHGLDPETATPPPKRT